jgi:cellulose synthase/poly-beta-1,6-N-acetylglucosamine synthase-like glycosyltransferase
MIVLFFNLTIVIIITINSIFKSHKKTPLEDLQEKSIAFFLPCYNESIIEINRTLGSFVKQTQLEKHKKMYMTICDGRKLGKGNDLSTDILLTDIVFAQCKRVKIQNAYLDSKNSPCDV